MPQGSQPGGFILSQSWTREFVSSIAALLSQNLSPWSLLLKIEPIFWDSCLSYTLEKLFIPCRVKRLQIGLVATPSEWNYSLNNLWRESNNTNISAKSVYHLPQLPQTTNRQSNAELCRAPHTDSARFSGPESRIRQAVLERDWWPNTTIFKMNLKTCSNPLLAQTAREPFWKVTSMKAEINLAFGTPLLL